MSDDKATLMVVRAELPIFTDRRLEHPTSMHSPRCPATRPHGQCRCGSRKWRLLPRETVQLLDEDGPAVLIKGLFDDGTEAAPCWTERRGLLQHRGPRPTEPEATPTRDIDLLRKLIAQQGFPTYKRRRIPPTGGCLVVLRSEYRSNKSPDIWRYLASITMGDEAEGALLVDPELNPGQALFAPWNRCRHVLGSPSSTLLVLFPLPDGTETPGWHNRYSKPLRRS